MKKALTVQLDRSAQDDSIKDGGASLTCDFISALQRRGYDVDSISGNSMAGLRQYTDLSPFHHRIHKAKDFGQMIKREFFDPYDLVLFLHPSTLMGFHEPNFPPLHKIVLFPTLLGKEYSLFMDVPEEYLEMEKNVLKQNFLIQSPSHAQAKILKDYYEVPQDRIVIHPRGFFPEKFPPQIRELKENFSVQKPFKLFSANALRPQKGYEILIPFAKLCREHSFPVKILIYGSLGGSNRLYLAYSKKLIDSIKESHLQESFELHEAVPQKRLNTTMNNVDIGIVPSIYESFGKSVLEATASGLPTVVFDDIPAYREFLNDTSAAFCKRNPQDLFSTVKRLASDSGYYHRLSINGIKNGKNYFADEVYSKMIIAIEKKLGIL